MEAPRDRMPNVPLLRHFWLLVLALMLVNVAIWRRRLETLVARGRATPEEAAAFVRGAVVSLALVALALEGIVLLAGWPSPLCIYTEPWTSPPALATWALLGVAAALLLRWVWLGHGDERLARVSPALGRGPVRDTGYTPRRVRLYVTAVVAVVLIGLAANRAIFGKLPRCSASSEPAGVVAPR